MKAKKSLENFFTFILIILLIVALIIEPLKNLKLKELAKFDKIIQNIEDYKSTYYQYPQKINLKYNNMAEDNYEDELGEQVQTGSITIGIIAVVGLFAGVTYYLLTRKNKLYKL